jgi:hypothetical protein
VKPTDPPRRTEKPAQALDLAGMLLLWRGEQPVLIGIAGAGFAVPLFTTKEKLEEAAKLYELPFDRIKTVDDQDEFLVSIPPEVLVVVDPWTTPQGTVRYLQVLRD